MSLLSPDANLPSPSAHRSLRERWADALLGRLFNRNLVYHVCWDDPALDRVALAGKGLL
jgi:hypothetical protein